MSQAVLARIKKIGEKNFELNYLRLLGIENCSMAHLQDLLLSSHFALVSLSSRARAEVRVSFSRTALRGHSAGACSNRGIILGLRRIYVVQLKLVT